MSVWGTINDNLELRGFSWKRGMSYFITVVTRRRTSAYSEPDLPNSPAYILKPGQPSPDSLAFSVPHRNYHQYGNINPFPIDYAFLPRLRGRLTLPRLTLDRNPWSSGVRVFTRIIVTYVSIRTSDTSSMPHSTPSQAYRTLPYPTIFTYRCRSFGA